MADTPQDGDLAANEDRRGLAAKKHKKHKKERRGEQKNLHSSGSYFVHFVLFCG
jgi:hypothetical protein